MRRRAGVQPPDPGWHHRRGAGDDDAAVVPDEWVGQQVAPGHDGIGVGEPQPAERGEGAGVEQFADARPVDVAHRQQSRAVRAGPAGDVPVPCVHDGGLVGGEVDADEGGVVPPHVAAHDQGRRVHPGRSADHGCLIGVGEHHALLAGRDVEEHQVVVHRPRSGAQDRQPVAVRGEAGGRLAPAPAPVQESLRAAVEVEQPDVEGDGVPAVGQHRHGAAVRADPGQAVHGAGAGGEGAGRRPVATGRSVEVQQPQPAALVAVGVGLDDRLPVPGPVARRDHPVVHGREVAVHPRVPLGELVHTRRIGAQQQALAVAVEGGGRAGPDQLSQHGGPSGRAGAAGPSSPGPGHDSGSRDRTRVLLDGSADHGLCRRWPVRHPSPGRGGALSATTAPRSPSGCSGPTVESRAV
ncbi:hypothetical protein Gobs01_02133 [Geodermatophilus obscurus DSM 43160]